MITVHIAYVCTDRLVEEFECHGNSWIITVGDVFIRGPMLRLASVEWAIPTYC